MGEHSSDTQPHLAKLTHPTPPPAGLALWLVPSPTSSAHSLIEATMNRVRNKLHLSDPPASAPFPPHATLLSGLKADDGSDDGKHGELWERALRVVGRWKAGEESQSQSRSGGSSRNSITTPLKDVVTRGWYFQILVVALQPTGELVRLNEVAREELLPPSDEEGRGKEYFPHVSLLYSEIGQWRAKELIGELKREGLVLPAGEGEGEGGVGVALRLQEGDEGLREVDFTHIELWDCNGDVGRWRRLERVRLADVAAAPAT